MIHLPRDVLAHSLDVTMNWVLRIRHQSQEVRRQVLVPVVALGEAFEQRLAFRRHGRVGFLGASKPRVKVLLIPLENA